MKLGLHMHDLKSFEGKSLLTFNNSSTRSCEAMDLPVFFGEGKNRRTVNVFFLVVSCESINNGILGRLFLAMLEDVAFTVHMNMK